MPATRYERVDFVIRLTRHSVRLGDLAGYDLPSEVPERPPSPLDAARAIFAGGVFRSVLDYWRREILPLRGKSIFDDQTRGFLQRICLRIDDERVSDLPLERALVEALGHWTSLGFRLPLIVRREPVPARVAQVGRASCRERV